MLCEVQNTSEALQSWHPSHRCEILKLEMV